MERFPTETLEIKIDDIVVNPLMKCSFCSKSLLKGRHRFCDLICRKAFFPKKKCLGRCGKLVPDHRKYCGMICSSKSHIGKPSGSTGIRWKASEETKKRDRAAKLKQWQDEEYRKKFLGDKSHFWRGGVTTISGKIRKSPKMKKWAREILERDNFTCWWCEQRGGKLEVDHIIPYSFILKKIIGRSEKKDDESIYQNAMKDKLLWDKSNARTLCERCHKKTETYLGKASRYKE